MLLVSSIGPTLRRLAPLHPGYLGVLWMPRMGNDPASMGDLPWAIDNGAYTGFDADKFEKCCKSFPDKSGCLFVVAPDVVGDAVRTLRLFSDTKGRIRGWGYRRHQLAFVAQDGVEDTEVPWADFGTLFIGGTTEFKMGPVAEALILRARKAHKWVHVGRVNSTQRLHHFMDMDINSIDGSRCTWFPDTYIPSTIAAIKAHGKQRHLFTTTRQDGP